MNRSISPLLLALSLLLTLGVLSIPTPALAQESTPFTGVVTSDHARIYAGVSKAFYSVGEVPKGTRVQVAEVIFDWYKIVPPKGVTSFISRMDVDAKGDGSTGIVNSNHVLVRAASLKGPGESNRVQMEVSKGAKVHILGQVGSFYRITPPKDAYVFLPPGSVQKVSAPEAGTSTPAPAPKPAAKPAPQPKPVQATPAKPVQPAPAKPIEKPAATTLPTQPKPMSNEKLAVLPEVPGGAATQPTTQPANDLTPAVDVHVTTPAVSAQLRQVEMRDLPLFKLPVDKQPIPRMINDYQQVSQLKDLPQADRVLIKARLAALKRNEGLAAALKRLDAAREAAKQDQQRAAAAADQAARNVHYDIVGKLVASNIYNGKNLPRLFRLLDPTTGRTIAYVRPTAPVDADTMLGKVVGVVGKNHFDASLRVRVVDIKRIDVLQATK